MPLETALHIDDLVSTNPTSTDTAAAGDDHIRMIKAVLKRTFPGLDAPVNLVNTTVPIGAIMIWHTTGDPWPAGWALCNGQTVARSDGAGSLVTPNLRGRFVRGVPVGGVAGSTGGLAISTAAAGGTHSHATSISTAPSHTHGITVSNDGAHEHVVNVATAGSHGHGTNMASAGSHDHSCAGAGDHSHGGNTGSFTLTVDDIPAHSHYVVSEENASAGAPVTTRAVAMLNPDVYALKRSPNEIYANKGNSSLTGGGTGHSHSISASGSHSHNIGTVAGHVHGLTLDSAGTHSHTAEAIRTGSHTHPASSASAGSHSHTASNSSDGSHTHSVPTVPPYVDLHYIIKY